MSFSTNKSNPVLFLIIPLLKYFTNEFHKQKLHWRHILLTLYARERENVNTNNGINKIN